jgi:hypothetical protein
MQTLTLYIRSTLPLLKHQRSLSKAERSHYCWAPSRMFTKPAKDGVLTKALLTVGESVWTPRRLFRHKYFFLRMDLSLTAKLKMTTNKHLVWNAPLIHIYYYKQSNKGVYLHKLRHARLFQPLLTGKSPHGQLCLRQCTSHTRVMTTIHMWRRLYSHLLSQALKKRGVKFHGDE